MNDEYYPNNGPGEEDLYRQDARVEEREARRLAELADRLLGSVTSGDASAELFTFHEIRRWALKHERKRPRD